MLKDETEKEMSKWDARVKMVLETPTLMLTPDGQKAWCIALDKSIDRTLIYNLRAVIFQIKDSNDEMKELKEKLIELLRTTE